MIQATRPRTAAAALFDSPAGFARDISHPPREWAARFFNLRHWSQVSKGGHFAALEQPQVLAEEIRSFFRPLRLTAC